MHPAKLINYLLLGLCCFCWSCKPKPLDSQQPQNRVRIKRVTVDIVFIRTIDTYSYNPDGQLALVIKQTQERFNNRIIDSDQRFVLSYDHQKRLVRLEALPAYRGLSFVYTYSYTDQTNRPTSILYTPTSPDSVFNNYWKKTYQLYYGTTEFPIMITSAPPNPTVVGIDEYTYDNGNIVTIRQSTSDKYYEPHTIRYTFDDKPNPFYKLYIGVPLPGLIGFDRIKQLLFQQDNTFNKNNMVDSSARSRYEYDLTGHIIKTERSTFEYETF